MHIIYSSCTPILIIIFTILDVPELPHYHVLVFTKIDSIFSYISNAAESCTVYKIHEQYLNMASQSLQYSEELATPESSFRLRYKHTLKGEQT